MDSDSVSRSINLPFQFVYFTNIRDLSIHLKPKWLFVKKTPIVIKLNNGYNGKNKYFSNLWAVNCKTFQLLEFSNEFFNLVNLYPENKNLGNNINTVVNKWNINNIIYDDSLNAIYNNVVSNASSFNDFINQTYVYLKLYHYSENDDYKEINVLIKYTYFWKYLTFGYSNYLDQLKNNVYNFQINFLEFGNFLLSTRKYYKNYIKYSNTQDFAILWKMNLQYYFMNGIGYFFDNYKTVGYKKLTSLENSNNDSSEEEEEENNGNGRIIFDSGNNNVEIFASNQLETLTTLIRTIFAEQSATAAANRSSLPANNNNTNNEIFDQVREYDFYINLFENAQNIMPIEEELQILSNNEQNLSTEELNLRQEEIIRNHMGVMFMDVIAEYNNEILNQQQLVEEEKETTVVYKKIKKEELLFKTTDKTCNYCCKQVDNNNTTILTIGNQPFKETLIEKNFTILDFNFINLTDIKLDKDFLIGCPCGNQEHVICIGCLFESVYAELKTANKIGASIILDLVNFNTPHLTSNYRFCFSKPYDPKIHFQYFTWEDVKKLSIFFPEQEKIINNMYKNLYLTEQELEIYAKEYNWYFINYYHNEQDDENEENDSPQCFNHLIKFKNLSVDIIWQQIEALLNSESCTVTCPKCFTLLEKISDCNALRHCDIDICYICGLKSREFDYLPLDHWDTHGVNGCPRYLEDKYFEYKFYNYYCKECECFDDQDECTLIDHNRGKFYLNLHRQFNQIMHMLWSIHINEYYFEILDKLKTYLDRYEFEFTFYSGIKSPNPNFKIRKYTLCQILYDKNILLNNDNKISSSSSNNKLNEEGEEE